MKTRLLTLNEPLALWLLPVDAASLLAPHLHLNDCSPIAFLCAIDSEDSRWSARMRRLVGYDRLACLKYDKHIGRPIMPEVDIINPLSDPAAVQRCTTTYTKEQGSKANSTRQEPRDVIIAFRITRSLVERIEAYRLKQRKRSRTDAVLTLLEAGLIIMENAERLDDPVQVKLLREKLFDVQIVDDVMEWPQDRVEAMIGVLACERERRLRLKIGRHYHG